MSSNYYPLIYYYCTYSNAYLATEKKSEYLQQLGQPTFIMIASQTAQLSSDFRKMPRPLNHPSADPHNGSGPRSLPAVNRTPHIRLD